MSTFPVGDPTLDLPFAYGGPVLRGQVRATPEDFMVEEELGYGPSGAGEHVFLTLRKRDRNTQDVAHALARLAGVQLGAVGFAGLKDRYAVTTQHFSVQMPGREAPDWTLLDDAGIEVLAEARHDRKIRRGSLRGNRFVLRIRRVEGDRSAADDLLQRFVVAGVPNYFGNQRFGRGGSNLARVDELFAGRGRRPKRDQLSILLSAARSQLFNQVLAERIRRTCWDRPLVGDVMVFEGAQRQFMYDPSDATIGERLQTLDLHPSGPLDGRASRALQPQHDAKGLEQAVLADWAGWREGLQRFGLEANRRALRVPVSDLHWQWDGDDLVLGFGLGSGAYATAVLRELVVDGESGTLAQGPTDPRAAGE